MVKYEQQTIVHKLADKNKYRGPPRPEVDEAWEELLQCTLKKTPANNVAPDLTLTLQRQ